MEYQLWGLDRHGMVTWAAPRHFCGPVSRKALVAEQAEHERFVDRISKESPGCPTSLTARKTVAIHFHPVGKPERAVTVWLQKRPRHRRRA